MAKFHFKDSNGNVLMSINVVKEGRIHTSSPRLEIEETKGRNFRVYWSTGLLEDIDQNDITNIEIER